MFFTPRKKVPMVYQSEHSECGLACVLMLLGSSGRYISIQNAREKFPNYALGSTVDDLCMLAANIGFTSKVSSVELNELHEIQLPVIIHWQFKHFVVLTELNENFAVINDPAIGIRKVSIMDFSNSFTGMLIELHPGSKIVKVGDRQQRTIFQILKPYKLGLNSSISKYLTLACLSQGFALIFPLLYHVIIDRVINYGDSDLLDIITLFLVGFCMFHAATNWIKAKEEIFLSATVGYRFYSEIGERLVKASAKFFESRRPQFITSTMTSSRSLEKSLNGNILGSFVDGVFCLVIIAILLVLDYRFFFIILLGVGLYILLAFWFFHQSIYVDSEQNSHLANERNNLTEFVSNFQLFKIYSTERQIFERLMDDYKISNKSIEHIARVNVAYKVCSDLIFYLLRIAIIYFAARFSVDETFSIGFLFCIFIYCNLLITRMQAIIDVFFSLTKLSERYSKIDDLIYSERTDRRQDVMKSLPLTGSIQIKNIIFSISDSEKPLLKNLSLTISPGQIVAIYGKSGSGKSTFMKILVGLYRPTKGDVIIEGINFKNWDMDMYRSQISAVFQSEKIISGSIIRNIVMFDKSPDFLRVVEIAKKLGLDDVIQKLPMKYETNLREGEGAFSGGQKQQLIIARALYKNPKILFLDEATVFIDKNLKAKILDYLASLELTIIVTTHEAEYLDYADAVYSIKNGEIAELGNGLNVTKEIVV
ncbi:MAG: peptidase domain-containing ABC transporter [Gammaproteobacteria bacterium]|nr:MAG: peptidase domain-containing ABC transporter [Gammaproteobacteria bacterium]